MKPAHAPGWGWRKAFAGRVQRPWGWSTINGGQDLPAHVSGLCEAAWHQDCPQAPRPTPAGDGQCACTCHETVRPQQLSLFEALA